MTPRRWLNIGVAVILLVCAWRTLAPYDGDCGPPIYESFRPAHTVTPANWLTGEKYGRVGRGPVSVTPACRDSARNRTGSSLVTAAIVGVGYVIIRRQLPSAEVPAVT